MKKNLKSNMQKYWDTHHQLNLFKSRKEDPLGLDVICVTGMPLFYNKMLHFFNKCTFKKLLKKTGPVKGKRILDIGCGTGRWTSELVSEGAIVTGIDLSYQRMKDNSQRIPKASFAVMSATDMKFKNNTFDCVTSVVVLQHIKYELQEEVISEISRTLKEGGYFLMIEGTKENETTVYNYSFPRSSRQWKALLEKNGLICVATDTSVNFVLITQYMKLKQWVRQVMTKNSSLQQVQHKNSSDPNPYDYESLIKFQNQIQAKKRSRFMIFLKGIDISLLWIVVQCSYIFEFFNQAFFHYYPTSEKGFLCKKIKEVMKK